MKLFTRQDIAAPIEAVHAAITDFDTIERAILRRGGSVTREDPPDGPGAGSLWQCRITYRGRERRIETRLAALDPHERVEVRSAVAGIDAFLQLDLARLSPRRTRVRASLELRPTTVPGRLYLQSLRLAKGRIEARFRDQAAKLAKRIGAGGGADRGRRGQARPGSAG